MLLRTEFLKTTKDLIAKFLANVIVFSLIFDDNVLIICFWTGFCSCVYDLLINYCSWIQGTLVQRVSVWLCFLHFKQLGMTFCRINNDVSKRKVLLITIKISNETISIWNFFIKKLHHSWHCGFVCVYVCVHARAQNIHLKTVISFLWENT